MMTSAASAASPEQTRFLILCVGPEKKAQGRNTFTLLAKMQNVTELGLY
jgi:hypothetical protein